MDHKSRLVALQEAGGGGGSRVIFVERQSKESNAVMRMRGLGTLEHDGIEAEKAEETGSNWGEWKKCASGKCGGGRWRWRGREDAEFDINFK